MEFLIFTVVAMAKYLWMLNGNGGYVHWFDIYWRLGDRKCKQSCTEDSFVLL